MGWDSSRRRAELPKDWEQRRQAVKTRANGQCEHRDHNGVRCTDPGTECHHLGSKHDHDLINLQWICVPHHKAETQAQARQSQNARYYAAKKRPAEKHPGAI